jgi:hypothetical protein
MAKTNITGNLSTVVKNCKGLIPWKLHDGCTETQGFTVRVLNRNSSK